VNSLELLQKQAQQLRLDIVEMIYKARSGHTGGSLSIAEILTVLYEKILRIKPDNPLWPERDRFILSKGHGAPALYAVLANKGFFDKKELGTLRRLNSCLQGHPCMFTLPGIEMSTGSLGMGISVGVGMALAARLKGLNYKVYVLCGDGELQEGQNWEALMSVAKWNLNNLTVIIDRNHVQLDDRVDRVMPLGDLETKLKAFGLDVISCDGHDVGSLVNAFTSAQQLKVPAAIVAQTIKGKGVSFMEGQSAWHGKTIGKEEYDKAIKELKEGLQ
jgi:transketolase